MEEELECCDCECGSNKKKVLLFAGLAAIGVSLIALGTSIFLKKKNKNN